jgi:hypothetical protein
MKKEFIMILTKTKNRVVYIGKIGDQIKYIGRGYFTRAVSLLDQNGHHIEADFDQIEILGPYSYEESKNMEKQLIEEYLPELNYQIKISAEKTMKRKIDRLEKKLKRKKEREQFHNRVQSRFEKRQYIVEQIEKGIKLAEIARELDVSRQYISKIKKETS